MLKSILVGLDGSPSSGTAIELGIQWAKRFNALLVGLGIVDEATIGFPESEQPIGGGYDKQERYEEVVKESRHTIEQFLEQFAARCTEADVSFNLLRSTGTPFEEIRRESQRCDLVLLGHETHFRFGTDDRPDRTLWSVLKREPRPVVIAPEALRSGSSVVVAYDGSLPADRALQLFQASGLDLGEVVCILSADENPEEAALRAERAVEFLQLHRINAVTHALGPVDSLSRSIVEEVQQRSARLLVMGAYGHSTVHEYMLGSVTRAVLKASPVPVFLCH